MPDLTVSVEDATIRYGWSINEEVFYGGDCLSRESAIEEARERWEEENGGDFCDVETFTVWTCVSKPYEPDWRGAVEQALFWLEENVGYDMGDASEHWEPCKNRELIAELAPIVSNIIKRHVPRYFWTVEETQKHELRREEPYDEMGELHKAALNRGQP